MNLCRFRADSVHLAFQAVREEAAPRHESEVERNCGTPFRAKALEMAAGCDLQIENFRPGLILEDRLKAFGLL
jgi:hypothetical protein